jgi:hypothetical protein
MAAAACGNPDKTPLEWDSIVAVGILQMLTNEENRSIT